MPVSPQDFELYSRMTGAPMPTDAMSRMQMAPDVYNFTKNFARKPNLLEKTGNLVKNIGRGAVMALGAPLVAASEAENARMQEQLRNQADKAESDSVTMENPTEAVADTPAMAKIRLQMEADDKKHQQKLELQDRMDARAAGNQPKLDLTRSPMERRFAARKMMKDKSTGVSGVVQTDLNPSQVETYSVPRGDRVMGEDPNDISKLFARTTEDEIYGVQQSTTADTYGQDYVPNQTSSNIVDRKISQGSQIADSTPNVAEVLSESQDSRPVDFADPVQVQQQMEAEMVGKSKGMRQLSKYMGTKGLDKALIGAFTQRKIQEEMFGEALSADSNLLDHPDLPGGEDDIGLPSGTNTSPTTNLQEQTGGGESLNKRYMDHADEMRRMEAQERRKRKSPSERQINLLEQRAIDNQEAIDSGFMSMSDEERANETARLGGDRIREMAETSPDAISETDLKRTGVLSGQLTRFPAGEETEKATERKRLRREKNAKADDFKAKFVEGALSDIVRGKRGNQSLGITRIPATNGEAQTGFVLANKPLDQSPTSATTYGFGVDASGEEYLKNQLGEDTFSTYMDRGMKEATKGKKRKAGEIFSYLTEPVRVVSGRAQLGNFGVIDPNFDLPSRRD